MGNAKAGTQASGPYFKVKTGKMFSLDKFKNNRGAYLKEQCVRFQDFIS